MEDINKNNKAKKRSDVHDSVSNADKKIKQEGQSAEHDDPIEEEPEFEDLYEDEYQPEEIVNEGEVEDDDEEGEGKEAMEVEDDEEPAQPVFDENWRPVFDKQTLKEGEVLEYDSSAYEMFHSMQLEWPCLTFDVIPDKLGMQRTKFPMTAYYVAGTQADTAENNKLIVMKLSQLIRTKGEDDSDLEDDNDLDDDPEVEHRTIPHPGGVNRLRCMPQEPNFVASWSDSGFVSIWDISLYVKALDSPPALKLPTAPIKKLTNHKTEGFAMDWSLTRKGRLLTGDCAKQIFLTTLRDDNSFEQESTPYTGHKDSIEDIQWSPTEPEVFASCSVDKTVKVWDARMNKFARSIEAGNGDINVISWNRLTPFLLASGCDDGTLKIWDLRSIKDANAKAQSVASFTWHKKAITSIEWDPCDDSVFAAASEDDQVTVWDLSTERDEEETKKTELASIPPQLLFIHQGQENVKEIRFHPQLPSVIASTAEDSFNIFKPSITEDS